MSWKEYRLDNRSIADWLPWEGITHPNIVVNKDDSMFAVLSFRPLPNSGRRIALPEIKNGWSIWCETQHLNALEQHFLCVCWNPFFRLSGSIRNALAEGDFYLRDMEAHLYAVMEGICQSFPVESECHILEYQELIDFMEFSLSMGAHPVEMPDTPVDLDALLSQDSGVSFRENKILRDDSLYLVYSVPGDIEDDGLIRSIMSSLAEFPWRDVRRMLLFGEAEAKKELARYTSRWCPGRKSILDKITEGILSDMNGYFSHSLIVCVPQKSRSVVEEDMVYLLQAAQMPYIREEFNARDVWWGSLPSLFRANIRPPIVGVSSLDVLLPHTKMEEGNVVVSSQSV